MQLPIPLSTAIVLLSAFAAAQEPGGEKWTQEELEEVTRRIEKDVESLRGHEFSRPVEVRLSDKETFVRHAIDRTEEHQSQERQDALEDIAKQLGLIPHDMDLMETMLSLLEEQVGGFYDPGEDTFYLMETFTGGVAEVILAHELTHALDDQLYDLDAGLEERVDSSDALLAYSSVVEGSGTNVMTRWTMGNMNRIGADELTAASSMGTEGLADAPPYLWLPLLATYLKGQEFLSTGYKTLRGNADKPTINTAIDRAFQHPPSSTEQVLHPEKYWKTESRDEPSTLRHLTQDMPQGWTLLATDRFGELGLALLTMPPDKRRGLNVSNPLAILTIQYTNEAAAGWDGDEVILLEREDGARVLHLATTWDSAQDALQFREALEAQLDFLLERQRTLADNGLGGWLLFSYADERQVSLALWSGCSAEDVEPLRAGPLTWTEDRSDP